MNTRMRLAHLFEWLLARITPEPHNADRLRAFEGDPVGHHRSAYGDARVPCGKGVCVLGDGHYGKCDQ